MSFDVQMLREPEYLDYGSDLENEEAIASILMWAAPLERAAEAAFEMFRRYRSISDLLSERPAELRKIPGVCDDSISALRVVLSMHLKMLREAIAENDFGDGKALIRSYCECLFRPTTVCVSKAFFGRNGRFVAESEIELGTLENAPLYPREIVKQAVALDANEIFVVFGRKFGRRELSENEEMLSGRLELACEALDIKYHGAMVVLSTR